MIVVRRWPRWFEEAARRVLAEDGDSVGRWRCADAKDSGVDEEAAKREVDCGDDPTAAVDAFESVLKEARNPDKPLSLLLLSGQDEDGTVYPDERILLQHTLASVKDAPNWLYDAEEKWIREVKDKDFPPSPRQPSRKRRTRPTASRDKGRRSAVSPKTEEDDTEALDDEQEPGVLSPDDGGRAEAEVADADEDRAPLCEEDMCSPERSPLPDPVGPSSERSEDERRPGGDEEQAASREGEEAEAVGAEVASTVVFSDTEAVHPHLRLVGTIVPQQLLHICKQSATLLCADGTVVGTRVKNDVPHVDDVPLDLESYERSGRWYTRLDPRGEEAARKRPSIAKGSVFVGTISRQKIRDTRAGASFV